VAHNEDSFRALEENLALLPVSGHCEGQRPEAISRIKDQAGIAALPSVARNDRNGIAVARNDGFFLIFGCSADKDISYAVKHIFPKAREVLLVKANHPRAMEPVEILNCAKKYQKNILIAGTVEKAMEYLKTRITKNSAIIIFGSFYLYNDIRFILLK
jgi:folylpolyglutamate synthase/dihydropteroate synthase